MCLSCVFQGVWLDEASGIKKTENTLVVASTTPKQVSTSWNKKVLCNTIVKVSTTPKQLFANSFNKNVEIEQEWESKIFMILSQ